MDYGKLSKKELISLCEERNLSFSSSWTKEKLEEVLISNDNKQESTNVTINDNGVGKAGAIFNIVFGVLSAILLFWTILFLIGGICSTVSNVRFYKGKNNKVMAGVLGLIFSGIIGGILVLVSNSNGSIQVKEEGE